MYQEFKLSVLQITGLSRDAVHIYVGLFVFFSFVAFFRKGKIEPLAVIPVLIVAASMEAIDLYDSYRTIDSMYWLNSLHDLLNTTFWPLLIVLLVKFNLVSKPAK